MSGARITDTLIVGAGQAGLALSRALRASGHRHVVLERGRIGERWRSERWESLSLLTPNWLNVLPGMDEHEDPSGFLPVAGFVDALERYASSFDAPVVDGVTVLRVESAPRGFRVSTDHGDWVARSVVVATGDSAVPFVPALSAGAPATVASLHASRYRAPEALPAGGVLVVGAGPTGQQLALELARDGRDVTIAVGRHARMPRLYRGRDIWEWLVALGDLDVSLDDAPSPEAAKRSPSLVLSGANGGEQLDLGVVAAAGVRVTGRLEGFVGHHAVLDSGLADAVSEAERRMHRVLGRIDDHVRAMGGGAPEQVIEPIRLPAPPTSLDLRAEGVTSVIWATGYGRAYPWLHVPVLDEHGGILQRHGVTPVTGLYTLGLKFQRKRGSHFIGGVGEDAELLAQRIVAGDETSRVAA